MQQFVFVGSMGTFPVPAGESRIGSDASCQICIHGDGILPFHAYIQTDGEKVLIRPADSGAAGGHTSASISIDGKKLAGPGSILSGQAVAIGNIQLRLLASGVKRQSLLSRRWFRTTLYTLASIAALALIAFSYVYFVMLDENTLKDKIQKAIATHLLRDDTEIGSVQVRLLENAIYIKNVKIKERHNAPNSGADFTLIDSVTINVQFWPLVKSWFHDYNDLHIVINKPEIYLDRSAVDGTFNIQDIVNKLADNHGPTDLGVNKLDFTVEVKDGSIRLNDDFTKIGKTSLEEINISLNQSAPGEPLTIKTCEMKVNAAPVSGTLKLSGHINAIDATGTYDTSKISSQDLQLDLNDVDLARIFEHFGYAWEPHARNFKVVLGKPISGKISVKIDDLKHLRFNGQVLSDSLLSIKEESGPPLGNIPMSLSANVLLADSGSGYRPQELDLKLLSGASRTDLNNPQTTYLTFEAKGKLNPGGVSNYTVGVQCALQDLCGTDVGKRLGLEGRLGGRLEGAATLILDANGFLQIDARMKGEDSYVMVPDPVEPKNPPAHQPLPLSFNCHANATPGASGELSEIVIESFSLSAPSFVAKSELQGVISGLGHDGGELEAQARFNLNLKGREFWTEFAPILALFGFSKPIEEILDMQILVWGKNNTIRVGARGKALRQWGADPAPVKLDSLIQYNAKAAGLHKAGNVEPFLSLVLEVASEEKPLYVRVEAQCSQNDKSQSVTLESFDKEDKDRKAPLPGLKIKSDVVTLRERFKPYIEGYLSSWDEAHKKKDDGWYKLYANTRLSGQLEQSGRIKIQRMTDPKSADPDRLSFDLDIAGGNLEIKTPMKAVAAAIVDAGPKAVPPKSFWTWKEDAVTIGLKGNYEQRLSDSKEEPDKERLNVEHLDVKGSLGSFQLSVDNLDIYKAANLRNFPKLTWTDSVGSLSMSGQLSPPACDFARSLNLIPDDHPINGTLALQILFDQKKDTLDLQKFVFKQTDQKHRFFLSNLDVAGSMLRVRDLSAQFLPIQADGVPFSERMAVFLDQGGPVALLDHLGDNLVVNSFQVETGPFMDLLKKDFGGEVRRAPFVISGLLKNDWRPEGTWQAAGLQFHRIDDQKNRKWELIGAMRNDFTCYGAAPQPGAPRPVVFAFNNRWSLAMGIAVSVADNTVALKGDALFDQAAVNASLPALNYNYKKPAGEPCKMELEASYVHGLLTHVSKLKLIGGPLAFEVRDFETALSGLEKRNYSVAELSIEKGPLPCLLSVQKLDPSADSLHMRLLIPKLDLSYLASLPDLKPPDALKVAGGLKDVNVNFKGNLSSLESLLESSSAFQALPREAHAKGLNSDNDSLEFDAQLDGVSISAAARKGQTAHLVLGGTVHLTPKELGWQGLSADIDYEGPETGKIKQAFTIPQLIVAPIDPKSTLLRSLKAPGLPLQMGAHLTFSTPVNAPALFSIHDTVLSAALGVATPIGGQGELKFDSIDQLAAIGSLKAPSLQTGAQNFEFLGTQNFTFKSLKLNAPMITSDFYGGKLILADTEFDLSKASVISTGGKFQTRGVKFDTRGNLTNGDLGLLLGGIDPDKNSYVVSGRIDAKIGLEGPDFGDPLNWKGFVGFKVSDLLCETPPRHGGVIKDPVAPWSAPLASLDHRIFTSMIKAANNQTVSIADLSKELPVADSRKSLNGLLLALQVYLARACGVEFNRFEFETVTQTVDIDRGAAEIKEPLRLTGRGTCAGLGIQVNHIKLNLADDNFADANIYPFAIPKSAEERMHLEKWDVEMRKDFIRDLTDGKMPLRITGRLGAPMTTYAWPDLKRWVRRALFNTEKIDDMDTLAKARAYFLATWGNIPADIDAAALLADRAAAGLPGTLTARDQNETILDRVPGLPHKLSELLANSGPAIGPAESLRELLFEPPDAPPAVPPVAPAPPVK